MPRIFDKNLAKETETMKPWRCRIKRDSDSEKIFNKHTVTSNMKNIKLKAACFQLEVQEEINSLHSSRIKYSYEFG